MEAFRTLTAVAAPLNMINIDTDMIIPKEYLKTIKRTGLGKGLFAELRYDDEGRENPLFVLNQPAYADIFYNNTFKNGMLPIILPEERVNELTRLLLELAGAEITVDLEAQTVTGPDGKVDHFDTREFAKYCLLNGLDDIGLTNMKSDKITAYEERARKDRPWAA